MYELGGLNLELQIVLGHRAGHTACEQALPGERKRVATRRACEQVYIRQMDLISF